MQSKKAHKRTNKTLVLFVLWSLLCNRSKHTTTNQMLVLFVLRFDHSRCINERQQRNRSCCRFCFLMIGLLMDPGVAHRICSLCQRPRRRLFAYPREQGLAEACAVCWLANEICQLNSSWRTLIGSWRVRFGFWNWLTANFASE